VEHLAGLLVALVVVLLSEPPRQEPQGPLGDAGHERERLEGGDDAVAPEERREPGDAGRVVRLPVELRLEQLQVAERAPEDAVEELVVRAHARAVLVTVPGDDGRRHAFALLGHLEVEEQVDRAARRELQVEGERAVAAHTRLRAGAHRRRPKHPVPADGREAVPSELVPGAVALRHDSAQLEHREEVSPQAELERELDRRPVAAPYGDSLPQRSNGLNSVLDADSDALRGKPLAARELEVRVRELVD
jgi:hypothetical protein